MANSVNYLKFPLGVDSKGQIGTQSESAYVRGLIEQVLFTEKRSRVNRPDFGVSIVNLTFSLLNDHASSTSQDLILTQLQKQLGHLISINNVEVIELESTMRINIDYTIHTNQNNELVSYQRSVDISDN